MLGKVLEEQLKELDNLRPLDKTRALGLLKENKETQERLKPIYDYFSRQDYVQEVFEIGEDFQIAQVNHRFANKEEVLFMPFLNYKPTRDWYYSLPEAIVGMIAAKYDGIHSDATKYIVKMLGIPDGSKQE